ncbi:MAG: hypothetical protein R6W48_13020 [Gaiellaceae bacterium]
MTSPRLALVRPVPHLDASPLAQLWEEGALLVGRAVELDDRQYVVRGVDPAGSDVRRVYLDELGSGRQHLFVVPEARRGRDR